MQVENAKQKIIDLITRPLLETDRSEQDQARDLIEAIEKLIDLKIELASIPRSGGCAGG